MRNRFRSILPLSLAALLALAGLPAFADGAEGSNRARMRMAAMDIDKDGRINKAEFLDMVGKVWDGHQADFKSADGRLTLEQVQAIQKTLAQPIEK